MHATATPYRERSHFDGQDVLESGLPKPGRADTGWLNRALGGLEAEARVRRDGRAFAVGPVTPLVVRGPAPVMSWTPQRIQPASEDTMVRLIDLYQHTDPELARAIVGRRDLADHGARRRCRPPWRRPKGGRPPQGFAAQVRAFFAEAAGTAAKFLARAGRAAHRRARLQRLGHACRRRRRLAGGSRPCSARSTARIAAVENSMGAAWRETVVAVVTEFGRTARINGTDGTDHGTGTIALLAGGALKGGRVIADWPGLKNADLHEGRDLTATTDLRAVLKGLLKDHLRVTDQALAANVFPGSADVKAMAGCAGEGTRIRQARFGSLAAAALGGVASSVARADAARSRRRARDD